MTIDIIISVHPKICIVPVVCVVFFVSASPSTHLFDIVTFRSLIVGQSPKRKGKSKTKSKTKSIVQIDEVDVISDMEL